jgi:hypothetical protein
MRQAVDGGFCFKIFNLLLHQTKFVPFSPFGFCAILVLDNRMIFKAENIHRPSVCIFTIRYPSLHSVAISVESIYPRRLQTSKRKGNKTIDKT